MKQILLFLMLTVMSVVAHSESVLSVDCQNPGWLSSLITYPQQQEVEDLTVSGYLNKADIQFINTLIENYKLSRVDLGKSVSTDGYVTFNYSVPIRSEDTNTLLGYKKLSKISMPQCDSFKLSLGRNSLVDTIQINSRNVEKAYGLTSNYGWYNSDIKKVILSEGVEVIGKEAFYDATYGNSSTGESIKYILDSFPSSLKQISENAFRSIGKSDQLYIDPDPSLVNPNIVFPPSIEYIGGNDIGTPDYYGYTYNQWYNGEFNYNKNTIELPENLKVWNGVRYVKGGLRCMTHLQCDSVIVPESMEKLWVEINAKVGIFKSPTPPEIRDLFVHINKVYVPESSLSQYQQAFKNADIQEILPIRYPEKIDLSVESNSIYIGDQIQIKAIILPEDALSKEIVWSSSAPEIVAVDNGGCITGIAKGEATITATASNGIQGAISITVLKHVEKIRVIPQNISLNRGRIYQLEYELSPVDASNKYVIWNSSAPNVCTVSPEGIITAVGIGQAIIAVSSQENPNIVDNCIVNVTQPVEAVSVSPQSVSLKVGESATLTASVLPVTAYNKNLIWVSSDESVATVDMNGKVTGIKGGEVKIEVISVENQEIKDGCIVTVVQPVTGLTLNKTNLDLLEDESEQLIATVNPENASNKTVNWVSSDNSIAMVASDGVVYALKAGQATIMATSTEGGFVALCKVSVRAKSVLAETLSLSITDSNIAIGETLQLTATVSPDNVSNKNILWASTDTSIAAVNETGLVTAIKEGNVQIIASTQDGSNISAICNIEVSVPNILISSISINPSNISGKIGEQYQLEALIVPDDATNKAICWSSNDSMIVEVDEDGLIILKARGTAIITATAADDSEEFGTCVVDVSLNSSISDIQIDECTEVKIYNLMGVLIYRGRYSELNLSPGTYIVDINGERVKRIIR